MNQSLELETELFKSFESIFRTDNLRNIVKGLRIKENDVKRYLCIREYEARKKEIILNGRDKDYCYKYGQVIISLSSKYNVDEGILKLWLYGRK